MAENFTHDVIILHCTQDRTAAGGVAEYLRGNGLRVWFYSWEVADPNGYSARMEEGLEHSRVLVLCLSGNTLGKEWPQLEASTLRFRDPINSTRCFIPVRLDLEPLADSLTRFLYIDWQSEPVNREYDKLLEACRPPTRNVQPELHRKRRLGDKVLSLGHVGSVNSVAFSPDGKFILSCASDSTVRLWDSELEECLGVLEGHSSPVQAVSWSPSGLRAISASADKTLRLWNVADGNCVYVFDGHSGDVSSVCISSDGRRSLSGSSDKTMRLWDLESGRCLRIFEGHTGGVTSVALGPNSQAISASEDKTVRIWDIESGRCMFILEGHAARVACISFSPDESQVLTGSLDKSVRIWDFATRKCLRVLHGHTLGVTTVAWSPDSRYAISGSDDNSVRIWDLNTGRLLRNLDGHQDTVWSVAWNPLKQQAVSASSDSLVFLWDTASGRCLNRLKGHLTALSSVALDTSRHNAISGSLDKNVQLWDTSTGKCLTTLKGHFNSVSCLAWSPDGQKVLSGSADSTIRLWQPFLGTPLGILQGKYHDILSAAWSPDGRRVLAGAQGGTLSLWEVESELCVLSFESPPTNILSLAWSRSDHRALSGSSDAVVRVWDMNSGRCLATLQGHFGSVLCLAWNSDETLVLSGSLDNTVRLWDTDSARCLRVLEGHSRGVTCVAWSNEGRFVLSGSLDRTVRLWDVESGHCLCVLYGHTASVLEVAWGDGNRAYSCATNGVLRVWNVTDFVFQSMAITFEKGDTNEAQIQYTNAKVLLVGESGAGKTGLSKRLALNEWEPTDSTVGAWATQWKLPMTSLGGFEREIWLWDFGGQADQRLIHQLFMEDTAAAVLVFDGQKDDLFETLGQWDRDLQRASGKAFTKFLVAGRVDAGGLRVSRTQMQVFANERGFAGFIETSAKANIGCQELKELILKGIDWETIPWRSSPVLFKRLKDEIIRLKDDQWILMRFNELRDALRLRLSGSDAIFKDDELKAVIGLLAGPGLVWELKFGSWILLQPERINAYAQAVIQTLRADTLERGCLFEKNVLNGELTYHSSMERMQHEEERFVLLAMHQTLVERSLCLRENTEHGPLLIFPTYYRRERPDLEGHPAILVSYRFTGPLDEIYATLVVRLHYTGPFVQDKLWRYAADFKTPTGKTLGVKLHRRAEGAGELEAYFDPTISLEEKIIFSRYIHEHLLQKAQDVHRLRHYVCPHCGTPTGNYDVAMRKLAEGKKDISCINCDDPKKRIPLWDGMEELFASPEMKSKVRRLQAQVAFVLDNESKERALVGDVISTVALSGQISRELSVSDHGIDMEIEFKSDSRQATGRKLYLQLKSGDSYIRENRRDGTEVFTIKEERHSRYWMEQGFPVMLVHRNSEGEVRWMEISDYLKRVSENGKIPVKQLTFQGERFDVMSVRRWRDQILSST